MVPGGKPDYFKKGLLSSVKPATLQGVGQRGQRAQLRMLLLYFLLHPKTLQVWGSPHTGAKIAFDVGIVEPNSNSHSARSGCSQSLFNVNAGTRDEEERERESQAVQSSMQDFSAG